jgi:flavodoxin
MAKKALIVLFSYHHKNTEQIVNVLAKVLDAEIKAPQQINPEELKEYNLVGFGSGIYDSKHHKSLFDLVERLPEVNGKKAFIFSTCGVPVIGMTVEYVTKNHSQLKEKLQDKGYVIIDEVSCVGLNTNAFLRHIGGINKGRPNAEDLRHTEEFAKKLKNTVG